jgi:ribonuclease R
VAHDEPGRSTYVALLAQRGRLVQAQPFFERGRLQPVDVGKGAKAGRLVLVGPGRGGRRARVLRVLGRPDVARDVLAALLLDRGLAGRFGPGIERAAQEAVERVGDDRSRRDLRDLPTFTIDPATAKDFDDAISAERLEEGRARVWVHIADVSAYVRPGSPVDREAFRRATSVYVPGLVEPMLPEVLSDGACSLVPGQERLAVTVELDVEGDHVTRSAFYRSRIRSDQRWTYEQVDGLLADGAVLPLGLDVAREVAQALDARRARDGALAVQTAEPEFAFDRGGHVLGAEGRVQTASHTLIEHLMIAANTAVATFLADHRVAALHRIHERPEPERVERLLEQLESLGVPTPPVARTGVRTGEEAARVVAEASHLVEQEVARRGGRGRAALTSLVLRALRQARYGPELLGHAGLGLERYCHFTSPIRRYPDLVCHRALLSAVGGDEEAPRPSGMEAAGTHCSARERDAMAIERDADRIAGCFLLERRLFEGGTWDAPRDGEVVGLIGAGAFVAFDGGFEGLVPVRRLGRQGEWLERNEQGTILAGDQGTVVRLGDPLAVRVTGVDVPRGRIDLEPVR